MRSIRAKLMILLGLLTVVICVGLGVISYINSYNSLTSNIGKTLPQIAEQVANNVQGTITGQLNELAALSELDTIRDMNIPMENKMPILLKEVERKGSIKIGIADKNGNAKFTDGKDLNVADREYFKRALSGEPNVSDPIVSKTDNSVITVVAVPIRNGNEVVAVLIDAKDGNKLSEITNKVVFGKTGNAFMISEGGTTIAHNKKDLVLNMYSAIEDAKKNASVKQLADIETKMVAGEKGIGEYYFDGVDKYVAYAPVKGTSWSVAVVVAKNEVLSELNSLKISVIAASVIFNLIGFVGIYFISMSISRGIKLTSKHLELLSSGDLTKEVSSTYLKAKDEVGEMTKSMKVMQDTLREMIGRIKENSSNIDSQSQNLSAVSEELSSSSQNVSEAINDIAQGIGDQSEDLLNVAKILNDFSNKLSDMVEEIKIIDSNSREIGTMAESSSKEMNELNESVTQISNSFKNFSNKITGLGSDIKEINEITGIINNIAEQTNLLALNAAIEASRAGEAGRGFAVVAEEIRKLAEQSKTSAESISKLINEISKNTNIIVKDSVEMDKELLNQVKIIDSSIDSFKNILEAVNEVIPKIDEVKTSAESIENDKNSIMSRIDGVSSVSQEISASSEEIAATSQEMNASTEEVASAAQILSNMTKEMLEQVDKFKV